MWRMVLPSLMEVSVSRTVSLLARGLVVTDGGATVTNTGLTVTAGGMTVSEDGLVVTAGGLSVQVAGGVSMTNGGLTVNGDVELATNPTVYSDRRLKTNITRIEGRA